MGRWRVFGPLTLGESRGEAGEGCELAPGVRGGR